MLPFARLKNLFLEHENKNTTQKTERDVRLLERFLKIKNRDRKIEDIPAAELNTFNLANLSSPSALKMAMINIALFKV